MLITIEQYFGWKLDHADATSERKENARILIIRSNALIDEAIRAGVPIEIDPDTGTCISGTKGGQGDGGFRLSTASTGRPGSSHKEAQGLDIYDPRNALDNWLTRDLLKKFDLYREHPDDTNGWCHVQWRVPKSKCRTYKP